MTVIEKLSLLRSEMKAKGIDAFIVYSTDPHIGEYTPAHWNEREWLTGFTGSVGTAVITKDKAGLWTDSRYFIQADQELAGSGIKLFKEGVYGTPTYVDWLKGELSNGNVVGLNSLCTSVSIWKDTKEKLLERGIKLVNEPILSKIWTDRPNPAVKDIFTYGVELSGESIDSKINKVRGYMSENGASMYIIGALDEIAWLCNLRGRDLEYNPIFTSYLIITEKGVKLYVDTRKCNDEVKGYLAKNGISLSEYDTFFGSLKEIKGEKIVLSPMETNQAIHDVIFENNKIIEKASPVQLLKAVKNSTEIAGFKSAMIKDGVALCNFIYWLENNVGKEKMDEYSIAQKLIEFRAEQKDFICSSFEEIVGYQGNGAIVHYHVHKDNCKEVEAKDTLLIDSGAHYKEGTTDITRVFPLGKNISQEFKDDYTLVLKGMINLCTIQFPKGTCGTHIDAFARINLWNNGKDFGHGTGHGVGCCSLVHEGPQSIRKDLRNVPLLEGMVCSDEPGLYIENRYGIRIENLVLVKKIETTDFGDFLGFETLTFCPINLQCVNKDLLSEKEITWLNNYHSNVEKTLSPLLQSPQKEWLKNACKPI